MLDALGNGLIAKLRNKLMTLLLLTILLNLSVKFARPPSQKLSKWRENKFK